MKISPEIRSKISQLDDLANEIREYFEDNNLQYKSLTMQGMHEAMEELGSVITEFQESQGWLDDPECNMPGPGGKPHVYNITPESLRNALLDDIRNKVSKLDELYWDNTCTIFEFGNLHITSLKEKMDPTNGVITHISQSELQLDDRIQLQVSIYYTLGCMIITFEDKEKVRIPID